MSVQPFQCQGLMALSDEILVLILSFLRSHGDLLACSQTSQRFRKVATDKSLVRRLNFRRDVKVTRDTLKYFFSAPQTCMLVRSLNLNGLYWLPPSSVHAQVVKMRNLQELHVGDILLSARQFSSIISKLSQLRKLSLSWTWLQVEEVEEITAPALAPVYQQLEQLNIFLATGDRCPLDKVTWLLAQCRDLTHLAILSQLIHRDVRSSVNKYNIVITTKQFHLPVLASVVWEMRNQTFPSLLEWEVLSRLSSQCSQVLTNSSSFFSRQKEGVKLHDICYQLSPDGNSLHENIVQQSHLVCSHRKENLLPSCEIWRNLRELSINHILCSPGLLISLEKLNFDGDSHSMYRHDEDRQRFLRNLLRENPKKLKHLELRSSSEKNCSDLVLEETVSAAPQLQTLVLSDVGISARQNKILASLLQSCCQLSHLQLTNIHCPDQRLFADLQRALLAAKQLKHLQIHQKQLTQHSDRLLASLAENCDNIQQVVLIDPSRAFNLKKFPTENVIKLVQKKSMRFFYLCSELLTLNDIKILKRSLKTLLVSKPHLLVKLQSTLASPPGSSTAPFYSLEDIKDLPMEYQRVVAASAGDPRYRYDNTSVARITVDDVF